MKFGVRECADICFKAKAPTKIGSHVFAKNEPVLYLDTAKTSTLESASTTVYAQGGRGNARLLAWEGEKTLTFTVEDALISDMGLAILSGADLLYAGTKKDKDNNHKVTAHTTQTVSVTEDGKITLKEGSIPSIAGDVYVMLLDGNGEMSGVPYKLTAPEGDDAAWTSTLTCGLVKKGDIVLVDYYVEHTSDAIQIDITPDKFAGYYYVEASTLYRRQVDGVDLPAEIIIPKVKIQSNFTFTMASSGDPSTFTFTMDAFPDYTRFDSTKKVLCSMQILNADDNFDGGESEKPTPADVRFTYDVDGTEAGNERAAYFGTKNSPKTSGDSDAV